MGTAPGLWASGTLGIKPGPDGQGFDWCSTNQAGPLKHFDTTFVRNRKRMETKGYREDLFFDETMAFIEEAGNDPFFATFAPTPTHPWRHQKNSSSPSAMPDSMILVCHLLGYGENIDYNLGRLMKFLKDTGRDEDTIVIMVNDNGVTEGLDVYNANMSRSKVLSLGRWYTCLFLLEMAGQMETKSSE